jgi:hypothetical protein
MNFIVIIHKTRAHQTRWSGRPWLQWNRPISVKKGISLIKSVFFSPIIILFLQYSRKRSSHVPYFIPNSLIASFLRSLCSTFVLWKVWGHAVVGKETLFFVIDFQKSPRFSLTSPLSQLREKSSRPVFTMCG